MSTHQMPRTDAASEQLKEANSAMKTYKIASIPADGIGPEVIAAGLQALEALARRDGGFEIDVTEFDWSSERYKKTGALMPEDGRDQLKKFDAIFFGAVGAPDVPDHVTLWGLRLPICQALTSMPMCAPPRSCPVSSRRSKASALAIWIG